MPSFSERLQNTVAKEEPRLRAISEESAHARSNSNGWSKKQELGHLIDSAVNNRVRFVEATIEGHYAGPGYNQNAWVELGDYAEIPWASLIDLWKMSSQALARLFARIPPEQLSAPCHIGDAAPVSLEFLIDDYIRHMQHHLGRILAVHT